MSAEQKRLLLVLPVKILDPSRAHPGLGSAVSHLFAHMAFAQLFNLSFLI